MKWLLTLVMLFSTPIAGHNGKFLSERYTKYSETNCPKNDIQGYYGLLPLECSMKCDETSNCEGFLHEGSYNQCWLKKACNDVNHDKNVDFYLRIAPGYEASLGSNCPLNDISEGRYKDSSQKCAMKCDQETTCVGFVYDAANMCQLKEKCTSVTYTPGSIIYTRQSYSVRYRKMLGRTCYSNNLIEVTKDSAKECSEECDKYISCVAFVYNTLNKCYLKRECDDITEEPDTDVYYKNILGYKLFVGKDCSDKAIQPGYRCDSSYDCSIACNIEKHCVAFAFIANKCYLKEWCGNLVDSWGKHVFAKY